MHPLLFPLAQAFTPGYAHGAVRVLAESEYNPTLHDREELQTI